MAKEKCHVANQGCRAPAGYGCYSGCSDETGRPPYARCKCFACGLPVCSNCSKIVKYKRYGKRRLCDTCIEENEREEKQEQEGKTRLGGNPILTESIL